MSLGRRRTTCARGRSRWRRCSNARAARPGPSSACATSSDSRRCARRLAPRAARRICTSSSTRLARSPHFPTISRRRYKTFSAHGPTIMIDTRRHGPCRSPVFQEKRMASLSKTLAATPPMGWNSWNMFGNAIHEASIRETADALVSLGLKDCGYEYVVIDDCWSQKDGRDRNDDLIPDPHKFPNGMKALADYVHSLGLKIGIYSDAGDRTCAGYPGSYGFEDQDARLWASWGMDFLKYDYCNAPNDQATAIERYSRMGEALRKTGYEILFSLCEWGGRSPHLWGRSAGGHMWRVSGDVFDSWINIWVASA